jgi:hypothetical protein
LRVEFLDDLLGHPTVRELDEREPTRPACLAIDRHDDVRRLRNGSEVGAEIGFGRRVRQVPNEQTDWQALL